MIRVDVQASINTHLGGPGVCALMAPNLTITLPTWNEWPEKHPIMIKDMTGGTPNCTIVAAGFYDASGSLISPGLIDGQPSAMLLNPYEELTFEPYQGGNTWTIGD